MAWFTCMAGVGGKGNSVIVTCDADFAGVPITCTNGQKTYTKVCPSFSPYEVTFTGLVAGTWTISATVDGVVYSTTAIVTDITAVLSYGFNWKMWVDSSSSLHSSDYTDLADLLSDEAAIRQLFTEHAPTDYAASTATVTPDLATVLNNDLCAKWINLRDYALDTLYANPLIAAAMNSADKYFYGEWGIVDDTTTPPTWGAKGNVPVMTSNSAPYGTASASNERYGGAYQAFDGNASTNWSTDYNISTATIQYKFANPIKPKKVVIQNSASANNTNAPKTGRVLGSNDGTNFELIATFTNDNDTASAIWDIDTSSCENYYLYLRLAIDTGFKTGSLVFQNLASLQFYGRELSVSVPTMTGNTTPYGEAFATSEASSSYLAFKAFDGNDNDGHYFVSNATNNGLGYDFGKPISVRKVRAYINVSISTPSDKTIIIQGSNDRFVNDINNVASFVCERNTASSAVQRNIITDISDETPYRYWRVFCSEVLHVSGSWAFAFFTLQFYGLDYSEKEFEEGSTKKWLYDHGVELETITISGTGTKGTDAIQLTAANAQASATIDTTAYTLMRGKAGAHASGTNQLICGSGVSNFTANNMPYNNGFDVSSVNGSNAVGVKQTANGIFDAIEFWLE